MPRGNATGNDSANAPRIAVDVSGNLHVSFLSFASDLLAMPDFNETADVFVRDIRAGVTRLVSANVDGEFPNGPSSDHVMKITPGGTVYIAFTSDATDLTGIDANEASDVFLRNVTASTTALISAATNAPNRTGAGRSGYASLSADGRYVAFESAANDLHAADSDTDYDVFLRDTLAGYDRIDLAQLRRRNQRGRRFVCAHN